MVAVVGALLFWPVVELADPAPVAPGGVQVESDDTTATATWTRGPATAFRVQYSENLDFSDAQTQQVERNTFALSSLIPGTTYFLRVSSVRGDKVSRPSPLVRFTTGFSYVAPKLVVDSKTSASLSASWTSDATTKEKVKYEAQLDKDEVFSDPKTKTVSKRTAKFTKLGYKATYSTRVRIVGPTGVALSPWSDPETRQTLRSAPLRVASFNVLKSSKANWSARRLAIAETIRSQEVDVAGLQEATPVTVAGGIRQYADIVRVLGPDWALTEDSKGATGEARTVYNTKRLELVDHGYEEIPGSTRFGVMRYITWAIFEQKSTAKRFVFLNTHFVTSKASSRFSHRTASAGQMVRLANSISKGELPVVMAGDFNSAAHRNNSNGVYRTITGGGFVDPLIRSGKLGAAEKLTNADLKTVNKYARQPRRDASAPMIDHIFVSPMRVLEWETVAKLDGSGRFIGTIPSDHNMIRLTVYLP
ncbi:endonuclease/exonuclease/phosphatase family protein [Aeromicrobium sp. A1-2]|uniref:endonuclease/exonuclease/phosphatase family protein n=1 Tax=Aeromicrobium sp. A1-2 TaxID=2107713 RepID=UPI0013C2F17E|nr:endonuclease/exonuclease/phosphatase family protein [Aeromicrobium sp. A1-2]